jgi:thiamine biosynthesis protein ThiC
VKDFPGTYAVVFPELKLKLPDVDDFIGKPLTPKLVAHARDVIAGLRKAAENYNEHELLLVDGVWITNWLRRSLDCMERAQRIEKLVDDNLALLPSPRCRHCGHSLT